MKAIILSVGNEVLSGRVINTNTSYLSQQLEKIGYDVVKTVVVGDDETMLTNEVLSFVNSEYDVLITTGGLGPTHDDFTKEVICKTFGYDLVLREEALDTITETVPILLPASWVSGREPARVRVAVTLSAA